jgi:hypothetical protein
VWRRLVTFILRLVWWGKCQGCGFQGTVLCRECAEAQWIAGKVHPWRKEDKT